MKDYLFTGRDGSGEKIKEFYCTECGYKTSKAEYSDRDLENKEPVSVHVTLGFYGPNGNGYTYECRKCGCLVRFKTTYSPLKQLLG